jgi:hypothetical protein
LILLSFAEVELTLLSVGNILFSVRLGRRDAVLQAFGLLVDAPPAAGGAARARFWEFWSDGFARRDRYGNGR